MLTYWWWTFPVDGVVVSGKTDVRIGRDSCTTIPAQAVGSSH